MSGGHLPPLRPSHHAPPPQHASPQPSPVHAVPPPPIPHHHNAWNHLQIPNYFPRQPQVAHMSSDRPSSHSSLTWHTPTPSEHQQSAKSTSNSFRHTPTPPDIQLLKGAANPMFRHTPTPPDRDSLKMYRLTPTPPDGQSIKGSSNPLYRHTPTPPDMVHAIKSSAPLYRHTPPPDGHKGPSNPLYNLQQMMSGNVHPNEPLRDNIRGDAMVFSRHSPGLVLGSMDLSVTRSPRNGSQNGETGVPMSLSVRDATKINSLDSAEITKIHQVPSGFSISKAIELSKSSSPTPSSMSQSSNSPKSPKPASKRPVKKVDSILERLNSGSDGVVIVPVQHTPSPHSVIVSAHSLEDSNSRGSSSSCNITPVISGSNYLSCEITSVDKATSIIKTAHSLSNSENSLNPAAHPETTYSNREPHPLESHSVIKESVGANKDETNLTNYSNEDSNGSSSDGSRSRRRRKQLKTTRVETEDPPVDNIDKSVSLPNASCDIVDGKSVENTIIVENRTPTDLSRLSTTDSIESTAIIQKVSDQTKSIDDRLAREVELDCETGAVQTLSKTRRKSCSESETIDNIAAMIASTDSSDPTVKDVAENKDNFEPSVSNLINNLDQVLGSPTAETKNVIDHQIPLENIKIDSELSIEKIPNVNLEKNIVKKTDDNTVVQDKHKSILKTSFVEVENALEKMFAGIEEDDLVASEDKSQIPILDSTLENNSNLNVNTKSRKKQNLQKSSDGLSSGLLSSDECSPKKKQKPGKRKAAADSNRSNKKKSKLNLSNKKIDKKIDLPTKDAYDSGSNASSSKSRGPYVQIKGPRDSPLSVSVINTPIQEDDVVKPLQKIRNLKAKPSLNTDINFRNKVKSKGLHTSTLSMKYDATTTDTSWICVFCKRGPHTRDGSSNTVVHGKSQHMGDLFGPYLVTTDCPDYASMMNDPHDTLFKGNINRHESFFQNKQSQRTKKIKLDTDSSDIVKTSFPNEEMYLGMTEAGTNSFEIWLHEDCAVWAPGLYLVGPKIVGLEAAVWSCCTMRCSLCNVLGATVACIKRGCHKTMHVNCARADLWSLSEDDFMVYCNEHKMP